MCLKLVNGISITKIINYYFEICIVGKVSINLISIVKGKYLNIQYKYCYRLNKLPGFHKYTSCDQSIIPSVTFNNLYKTNTYSIMLNRKGPKYV